MTDSVRMRRIAPALILVLAAATGVGGGALTAHSLDDEPVRDGSAGSEPPDPEGLLYYADHIIYDDDIYRQRQIGRDERIGELARKAEDGWAIKEEWGNGHGRLVFQNEDNSEYGQRLIGPVDFDVSYDQRRLVYPAGDRIKIVSTTSGKVTGTVDVGLPRVDAVFFSGNDLVASGTDSVGHSRVMVWDTARGVADRLPLAVRGEVRLVDVSAAGGYAAVEVDRGSMVCPAVFALDRPGEAVWRDEDCDSRAYPDALSPDGRHLLTYPEDGTPTLPKQAIVTDLGDPTETVAIGGEVTDAGWTDDENLAVIRQVNVEPPQYAVFACTLDGTCVQELGNRGSVAKVGRVD